MAYINGNKILFSTSLSRPIYNLDINGVIREYRVSVGASVSAGDFVEFVMRYNSTEFINTSIQSVSAAKLDENRVLVAYGDLGQPYAYATVLVLTFDEENIIVGTPTRLDGTNTNTGKMSIAIISKDLAVVAFTLPNISASNAGYSATGCLISVDGDNVELLDKQRLAYNPDQSISGLYAEAISVTALSSDHILFAFCGRSQQNDGVLSHYKVENSKLVNVTICKYSNYAYPKTVHIEKISSGQALLIYGESETSGSSYARHIRARVVTVTDSTLNLGTVRSVVDGGRGAEFSANYMSICQLDSNRFLYSLSWLGGSSSGFWLHVIKVNGSTISYSQFTGLKYYADQYQSVVKLSENRAMLVYKGYGILSSDSSELKGIAQVLDIDDTKITSRGAEYFSGSSMRYPGAVALSENSVAIIYYDGGKSMCKIANVSGDGTVTVNEEAADQGTFVQKATTNGTAAVAKTSGSEGEMIQVYSAV